MTDEQHLCYLPATVIAAAIREKRVSPVEVVEGVYGPLGQQLRTAPRAAHAQVGEPPRPESRHDRLAE